MSLALLGADKSGITNPPRGLIERGIAPVEYSLYGVKKALLKQVQWITNLPAKEEEYQKNREELNKSYETTVKLHDLENENKALREQINAVEPTKYRLLAANTLGKNRVLIIDKGTKDGVAVGMTVIEKNILLGKVKATSERASQVQLITDPDSKIPVEILSETKRAKGIVYGQYQTTLLLDQVLQEENIKEGDLVITSGENQEYPKSLLIGKIEKIEKKDTEFFQKARVRPLVEIDQSEIVFVIL